MHCHPHFLFHFETWLLRQKSTKSSPLFWEFLSTVASRFLMMNNFVRGGEGNILNLEQAWGMDGDVIIKKILGTTALARKTNSC